MKIDQTTEWDLDALKETDWYKSRPPHVRARIDSHPFTKLYRVKETGQIVAITSYSEQDNGECQTCCVLVLMDLGERLIPSHGVFGIEYDSLDPICDAPPWVVDCCAEED